MKLFGDRIGKSSTKNRFFAIFVCRDVDWEKAIQLEEQHKVIKAKSHSILGRQGSGRLVRTFLFYHMIIFYIVKSSGTLDPEDSLLSKFLFYVIHRAERKLDTVHAFNL